MERPDRFLTTQQAAELLGVHRTTVLRLIDDGQLSARVYRYARERPTIRIPEAAVAAFLHRWTDEPHDER